MNYFLQGFGVFLGVIAAVTIALITQWISEKRKESQKVKNLKFEFGLNIAYFGNIRTLFPVTSGQHFGIIRTV